MAILTKTVSVNKCEGCGYEWQQRRRRKPKVCPICKSTEWNIPKVLAAKSGERAEGLR